MVAAVLLLVVEIGQGMARFTLNDKYELYGQQALPVLEVQEKTESLATLERMIHSEPQPFDMLSELNGIRHNTVYLRSVKRN